MDQKITFKDYRGLKISGVLSFQEMKTKLPGVILSHGFLSFKENKLLYRIAKKLEESGFAALRFDFSGCIGESQGSCDDIMLTHYINDLAAAVAFLRSQKIIDKKRIGLVGHSLGGLTSLIFSAKNPSIRSAVTIGAPLKLEWQTIFTDDFISMWEHDKQAVFKSIKGDIRIDFSFYKDLKEYNTELILKNFMTPLRIIHGDNDLVVLIKNAEALYNIVKGRKDLFIINGGDHMFLQKEMSDAVANACLEWLSLTI